MPSSKDDYVPREWAPYKPSRRFDHEVPGSSGGHAYQPGDFSGGKDRCFLCSRHINENRPRSLGYGGLDLFLYRLCHQCVVLLREEPAVRHIHFKRLESIEDRIEYGEPVQADGVVLIEKGK
jgi:hypothetical protein